MTNIENLNVEIASVRANKAAGLNNSQIISLTNLRWDIGDELIPVNFDLNGVSNAITNKERQ